MSIHTLLSNNQIREWSKIFYEKDVTSLNANDFELALRDYSFLKSKERLSSNFNTLNWFEFNQPSLYSSSLENYINYLTYVLIIKILKTQTFEISALEKYFTDQVIGYLTHNNGNSIELKELYTYWQNTFKVLETIVKSIQPYKRVNANTTVFFSTSTLDIFRIDIPLIAWDNPSEIDCFLFLPYNIMKPNWYSIPSVYKLYRYFSQHDIIIKNLNIFWFDVSSKNVKPDFEQIPMTSNVAEMVARYSNLEPFPYENIFDINNPKYYNKTPLNIILK